MKESITWQEVTANWKEREDEIWKEFYTEAGFKSWEQFRLGYIHAFKLQKRSWIKKIVEQPQDFMTYMYPGAKKWEQSYLQKGVKPNYKEMAYAGKFDNHDRIQDISKNFPRETEIIALRNHEGKIVTIEGHHRAAGAALAQREGRKIDTTLSVVMSDISKEEEKQWKDLWECKFIYRKKVIDTAVIGLNKIGIQL
ncbi:MAG: hypothetical protein ACK4NC_01920 [Candidatus Gracilibacteria bacterium]